jgi:cellulose synthase/poly-beta-1,6-N-acetylglucosamine synthase-like glycosyltransferase
MKKPKVSVIVPCYNEEKFIAKCLNSLIEQDFPKERMEVLVVDGNSKDNTRETIKEYIKKYPFIKLFNNKKKYTPFAINIGIKESKGDFILKLDAHADYDKNYISECVKNLRKYNNVDCVGGITQTVPKSNKLIPKSIVACLTHFFGAGSSAFRIIKKKDIKEPIEVDTIFGACYRKEVFERVGLFNENLIRSQDMELSMRIKDNGGRILLLPKTVAYYYPKDNLLEFWKHNLLDGIWAIYPLKFMKRPLKLRHLIPFFFVLSLISTLSLSFLNPLFFKIFLTIIFLYLVVNLYFSFKISLREKNLLYLFTLPLVFFIRHFGYGLGSLWGLAKLIKD